MNPHRRYGDGRDRWIGVHRHDPADDVPRPAGLSWLVPPLMYRTGFSARLLTGVLVLILMLSGIGTYVKAARGMDRHADSSSAFEDQGTEELPPTEPDPAESGSAPPSPSPSPHAPASSAATGPSRTRRPAMNEGRRPGSSAQPAEGRPPAGRYRLRLAHTGLCVGEGPELFKDSGREVLGQHPCGSASPPLVLEPAAGNAIRIRLDYPGDEAICATVDYGGTDSGLLIAGQLIHSGLCLGVADAAGSPWQPVLQVACDPADPGEVFLFDRA